MRISDWSSDVCSSDLSIGTIFSVLHAPHHASGRDVDENDFLQAGSQQVAAGYAVYGPQSMLVLTVGNGVVGFTLDREMGSEERRVGKECVRTFRFRWQP